jgi:Ca2+-binding RTX toxin-like protein
MNPRTCVPRALGLLAVLAATLAATAATAYAGTISYEGSTVVFTAVEGGEHHVQFRLAADGEHDEIYDSLPILTYPGDCVPGILNTEVTCPAHFYARVLLGSGNDSVDFSRDCFNSYTADLGNGNNESSASTSCSEAAVETATVIGGSGQDTFSGGSVNETFYGGGGNDIIYGGSGNDIIHGGEGNDRLYGGPGNDQVFGEGGNDDVDGGEGNDLVDGGSGDDRLEFSIGAAGDDPGLGADTYVGGPGTDSLWFDNHAGGMTISINGVADDGTPGEGDNVGSDIEEINGSPGNDVFIGSAGPDGFSGGLGNDEIHGGGGDDHLNGGGGDDKLYGEAGNDKIEGGSGADLVDGGPGVDELYGDIAGCSIFCSFDSDTILARDGEADRVDCGGGADYAQVDLLDVVAFCAVVDRPAPPGPSPAPSGGSGVVLAAVGTETLSPTAFAAAPSGPSALAAKRHYGTKVRYTLNQTASVRFTVVQPQPGRKARGGRCVKPTRANRKARKCTRLVALAGSFTRTGTAGANSFRFTGRLAGHKLKPGKYQLVATPSAGGRTGRAASASFRII